MNRRILAMAIWPMWGATMSRHEFAFAGEADEAAASLSNDPFPVLASTAQGARHSAADMIMEALLRECLTARRRTLDSDQRSSLTSMR